jgi:hypothetical protein
MLKGKVNYFHNFTEDKMSDWKNVVITVLQYTGGGYCAKILFETFAKNQAGNILTTLINNVNLPAFTQIQIFEKYPKDRYVGLVEVQFPESYSIEQVKQCLYEVYCVCRSEGLAEPNKKTILLPLAFSDKAKSDTIHFFERTKEMWLQGFMIQPFVVSFSAEYQHCFTEDEEKEFNSLISAFKRLCTLEITSQQAHFFMLCTGSLIGAVYLKEIVNRCIQTASQMTLDNSSLISLTKAEKSELFISLVKYLIGDSSKRKLFETEMLVKIAETEVNLNDVKNSDQIPDKSEKSFDLKQYACYEINRLNSKES